MSCFSTNGVTVNKLCDLITDTLFTFFVSKCNFYDFASALYAFKDSDCLKLHNYRLQRPLTFEAQYPHALSRTCQYTWSLRRRHWRRRWTSWFRYLFMSSFKLHLCLNGKQWFNRLICCGETWSLHIHRFHQQEETWDAEEGTQTSILSSGTQVCLFFFSTY